MVSFAVVLLAATGHIVAQSPADARKQLSTAEQAELEKAKKLNKQVVTLCGKGKYREATPVHLFEDCSRCKLGPNPARHQCRHVCVGEYARPPCRLIQYGLLGITGL